MIKLRKPRIRKTGIKWTITWERFPGRFQFISLSTWEHAVRLGVGLRQWQIKDFTNQFRRIVDE